MKFPKSVTRVKGQAGNRELWTGKFPKPFKAALKQLAIREGTSQSNVLLTLARQHGPLAQLEEQMSATAARAKKSSLVGK